MVCPGVQTVPSLGSWSFMWVQQVKGEGMSWGEPKTQRKTALPAPHGSNKLLSARVLHTQCSV